MTSAVISGIGITTPIGDRIGEVVERIAAGESNFAPTGFDDAYAGGVFTVDRCGRIDERRLKSALPSKPRKRYMSRESMFASFALLSALADAGLNGSGPGRADSSERVCRDDIGIYAGTGMAGLDLSEIDRMLSCSSAADGSFDINRFVTEGVKGLNPLISFKILPNMPVCCSSIASGIRGSNLVFNPWEGESALAFIKAAEDIESGQETCLLTGGSDSRTNSCSFILFSQYGLFPPEKGAVVGKPCCEESAGFIPSEGACYLVLEPQETAAKPYARVSAWDSFTDTDSMHGYTTEPTLLQKSIERTLERAECTPRDIDCIVLSADGYFPADDAERRALQDVFGAGPSIIFPREHTGNMFAASAHVSLAIAAHLISDGNVKRALVNSFGVGTQKAAFILEKIR